MYKLIKKCFEILQEKEKVVSTPLIQMFSQLIIVKLCHFHYFQIQCFAGSFLIENIFLFILYLCKFVDRHIKISKLWLVTSKVNYNDSENLAKPIEVG